MNINHFYLWQMAQLAGALLTLIYMAHMALKKRGKSRTNL